MEQQRVTIFGGSGFIGRYVVERLADLLNERGAPQRPRQRAAKALGETGSRQPSAVTLRTSFIGRELALPGHGLVEWFLAQREAVQGYARVIYSGLTSLELAGVVRRVIEAPRPLRGVHHVASEPIAKYDLLELVRQTYGLETEIRKVEEPVSDRSLQMRSFTEAMGYRAPSWPEMILRMKEDPTPYETWRS